MLGLPAESRSSQTRGPCRQPVQTRCHGFLGRLRIRLGGIYVTLGPASTTPAQLTQPGCQCHYVYANMLTASIVSRIHTCRGFVDALYAWMHFFACNSAPHGFGNTRHPSNNASFNQSRCFPRTGEASMRSGLSTITRRIRHVRS